MLFTSTVVTGLNWSKVVPSKTTSFSSGAQTADWLVLKPWCNIRFLFWKKVANAFGSSCAGQIWGSLFDEHDFINLPTIRIISGNQPQESITKHYFTLKIFLIKELYNFETAKIIHKASTISLPSPLNLYFKKVDNVHNIALPVVLFIKTIFSPDLKQKKLYAQLSFKVYPFGVKSILK